MFNKTRFKRVLLVSILLILVFSTFAKAIEVIYEKKFTAVIGRFKIKVDGEDVTKKIEEKYGTPPFVVKENSRSYIPLRSIAELMGFEVEWDPETHTAELIDLRAIEHEMEIEKYEKLLKEKDEEIARLKEEIEKLKEDEKKTKDTDLEALEKALNKKYGTYKNVYFDIVLEEDKNKIDVEITMDLKDRSQERHWKNMGKDNKEAMIEDIVDIILDEYENKAVYGSIYDVFYKKDFLTFSKPRAGKLSISHTERYLNIDEDYIDDVVYDEFSYYNVLGAYISNFNVTDYVIYFDVNIPSGEKTYWQDLRTSEIEHILDRVSDEVYDYVDYYYDYEDRNVRIRVYLGDSLQGQYIRYYDDDNGRFNKD